MFGGHRLWHGYALDNSEKNRWGNYSQLPKGGYLSDIWIYNKVLDFTSPVGRGFRTTKGTVSYLIYSLSISISISISLSLYFILKVFINMYLKDIPTIIISSLVSHRTKYVVCST